MNGLGSRSSLVFVLSLVPSVFPEPELGRSRIHRAKMDGVQSLHDERVEAAIANSLDAQAADITLIVSETQADKHEKQMIIPEQERHIHDTGRLFLEESRRELADLQHKSAVIASPILALPHEVTAEIFQWHTWIGGNLLVLLLVCKRWTAIAYASPRLWSRISLRNCPGWILGTLHCRSLNQLRLFLSRSQSSPLQIRIGAVLCFDGDHAPTSFSHKLLGPTNYTEAIRIILGDEILGRCTSITFGEDPIPSDDPSNRAAVEAITVAAVEAITVLPLLFTIRITTFRLTKHELCVLQSIARRSPSLRHIHYRYSDMSPQELGVESWAKSIETYGWVSASELCHSLQESPSLRNLRIEGQPVVPLTLLAVQELRWCRLAFPGFSFITAPQLHTLIVHHADEKLASPPPPAGSITLPTLRIAMHFNVPDITVLRAFQTPVLEHLSISTRSSPSLPTPLLRVFDGSHHMPTPKSLHLCCRFTDIALIVVLRRLPWLEELQVAGGIPQEVFWEALTPPCNLNMRSCPLGSYLDACVTDILVPKLQILLVDNSQQCINDFQHSDNDLAAVLSKRGEWTVTQASAAAIARERAGCPLKTLACWDPEYKATVVIGSLESLPRRPECVLFIAVWCS